MIGLTTLSSGAPAILQKVTPPYVYLDHFAVMEIARDNERRFANALKLARGTWGLSWVNFLEFASTDDREVELVEKLIAAVLPNVVFIEVESGAVISKENAAAASEPFATNPSIDEELAKVYISYAWGKSLDPLSPEGFVRTWREPDVRAELLRIERNGLDQMIVGLEEVRRRKETEEEVRRNLALSLRRKLGIPETASLRVPPTRFVGLEAIRHMVVERINLSDGHHIRDYWHTVVPISHCDFVCLDKHWYRVAVGIQDRLRSEGLLSYGAKVFRSVEGIAELVRELESLGSQRLGAVT